MQNKIKQLKNCKDLITNFNVGSEIKNLIDQIKSSYDEIASGKFDSKTSDDVMSIESLSSSLDFYILSGIKKVKFIIKGTVQDTMK